MNGATASIVLRVMVTASFFVWPTTQASGARPLGSDALEGWLRSHAEHAKAQSVEILQSQLGENEAALYFGLDGESLAIAGLTRSATVGPVALSVPPSRFRSDVERIQRLLGRGTRPARGELLRLMDELGDRLLGPLTGLLQDADRVLLHAGADFDALPFASLRVPRELDSRRGHLVEHAALCHASFARSPTDAESAEARQGIVLGAADPEFRRSSLPLGASMSDAGVSWRRSAARRLEVEALAEHYQETRRLFGTDLTAAALRDAGAVRLLHLAADVRGSHDFETARLELSGGDSAASPESISLRRLSELVRSEGGLAVLTGLQPDRSLREAAEENARNFLPRSAAEASSLTQLALALHDAGFSSALLSLWITPEQSSPAFFDAFYRALAGGARPAGALRTAQLQMIAAPIELAPGTRLDAREPVFWAGYRLYSVCR